MTDLTEMEERVARAICRVSCVEPCSHCTLWQQTIGEARAAISEIEAIQVEQYRAYRLAEIEREAMGEMGVLSKYTFTMNAAGERVSFFDYRKGQLIAELDRSEDLTGPC